MRIFRATFLSIFTFLLVYILNSRIAEVPVIKNYISPTLALLPPVGKFFDPFSGFWANAEPKDPSSENSMDLPGLLGKVDILMDDRWVPHIFAQNDRDAYYAQGYITASNRLWQMEFQTHLAAGRISEVVGERGLELDRSMRRLGVYHAAQLSLEEMLKDSITKNILEAYTQGVNAYIEGLSYNTYPIEYKLLNYKPEPWTMLKCVLLQKYMAFELSVKGNGDLATTLTAARYGRRVADSIFTGQSYRNFPVIPSNTPLDFKVNKKQLPQAPKFYDSTLQAIAKIVNASPTKPLTLHPQSPKGSNNWVVSGRKTTTGFPILANDPHLSLRLPSIWFELQIVTPTMNVYGVSLPGAPGVVIGFNEHISWGVTNAYTDVLDFYQIFFKDKQKSAYWYNNTWKETRLKVDTIIVRGKRKPILDTIYYTHHGPIVLDAPSEFEKGAPFRLYGLNVPIGAAMKWTGFETSNELISFYNLNHAKNFDDFKKALRTYGAPAQNFAYADNQKNIAIWIGGILPLRWNGQGKYVLDGSNPAHEYTNWIPSDQNPHAYNPESHYLVSANQFSVDSLQYPYYIGWDYISPERAIRIHEQLKDSRRITWNYMRELQNDNLNVLAREALPVLLAQIDSNQINDKYKEMVRKLYQWNYNYTIDAVSPTIFDTWWSKLSNAIWKDDIGGIGRSPSPDKTLWLIMNDSTSRWFDDRTTPKVRETFRQVARKTLLLSLQELNETHNGINTMWQWGKHKNTAIEHIASIEGFGRKNIETSGDRKTVNATTKDHGPSWRMVVELGTTPKAYGIYPGGQSGNPGSIYYDNMIDPWRVGELQDLLYLKNKGINTKNPKIISRIKLE